MTFESVLVTGGSGFVGAHCILRLLNAGYRVRTTVRSLAREMDVRAMLKVGGAAPGDALSFAAADLESAARIAAQFNEGRLVSSSASPAPHALP